MKEKKIIDQNSNVRVLMRESLRFKRYIEKKDLEPNDNGFVVFDWYNEKADECVVMINVTTSQVIIETSQISHHNGSPYGRDSVVLSVEQALDVLQKLIRALKIEVKTLALSRALVSDEAARRRKLVYDELERHDLLSALH